jgi:DNA repair protein RecN (Recombination protein N)
VRSMLVELTIRNFAIIPSLTVSFQNGLHVLTGETGAGKSMIMDAVSLLIGGRSSVDYIRHGENKAEIEGLFQLDKFHPILDLLSELGIEVEDDTLIFRRDISAQGKSICRINGKLVTLAVLRELGQTLVDIHGQHEHQSLLHEEKHMSLLDEYGKEQIEEHKQEFLALFQQYKKLNQHIQQLTEGEQQLAQRLDLVRFQLDEIAAAKLEPKEDEQLQQEKRKRTHAQKIFKGIDESYEAISGDGRALDALGIVMHHLQELSDFDEELKPSSEIVESIYYQLEDMVHGLNRYRDQLEFDPDRLTEIETRLMQLDQLKRKYGQSIEEILEYAAKIEDELDTIENKEERIEELVIKQKELILDLAVEAQNLTQTRQKVAIQLVQEIKRELTGLFMDKTEIDIRISPLTSGEKIEHHGETKVIRQDGWDDVQFLISPNPGEPLKPLSKIASGGELSRLMLSLKSVFSKIEPVTTLIFDEVDTGVSGRVAQAMAEKLYTISRHQQVLCISHQAQLAAMADSHYRIEKEMTDDETITKVTPLKAEESRDELARMMSGAEVTSATKKHASELIKSANRIKTEIKENLSK